MSCTGLSEEWAVLFVHPNKARDPRCMPISTRRNHRSKVATVLVLAVNANTSVRVHGEPLGLTQFFISPTLLSCQASFITSSPLV